MHGITFFWCGFCAILFFTAAMCRFQWKIQVQAFRCEQKIEAPLARNKKKQ